MYKIELTEEEVWEVGRSRYQKLHLKKNMFTFIIGFVLLLAVGFLISDVSPWNYIVLTVIGIPWLFAVFMNMKKEGKMGKEFLEEVKNDENES